MCLFKIYEKINDCLKKKVGKVFDSKTQDELFKVEIPLENKTFDTGHNIRLECKVEGFPIPTITWLKNNARLPKSTRIYVEEERFLVINRASPIGK